MPAKKTPAKKAVVRADLPAKKPAPKKTRSRVAVPRKVAKKKVVKKDNVLEQLWEEDELTYQYPSFKKNNILSLVVLALGALLVAVGIYIQIHKNQPANTPLSQTTGSVVVDSGVVLSGEVLSGNVSTGNVTGGTFALDAQNMVVSFFEYFNNEQFDNIRVLYDINFQNVPALRTYFSPSRLQRWKKNLIGDLQVDEINAVIDHPYVQKNPNAMVVQYKTHYTIGSNGKQYDETWLAYVLKYGDIYKLNGFECQENCAASPFFQLK